MLIRGIRGGFIGHEFHENDHCHLDVIGLKYNFSQSLRPCCLTLILIAPPEQGAISSVTPFLLRDACKRPTNNESDMEGGDL